MEILKKYNFYLVEIKENVFIEKAHFLSQEENKQIALGTSKLNYLDPRITVAW